MSSFRPEAFARARRAVAACIVTFAMAAAVEAAPLEAPPNVPARHVHDVYFGVDIVDPYRWMETPNNAEFADYLKRQNEHTQHVFASIAAPRKQLFDRIRALQDETTTVRFIQQVGDRYYYLAQVPGSKDAQLMTRPVAGGEARMLLDPSRFATEKSHAAVGYYRPSYDGRYVVAGICLGGSDDCTLRVVDTSKSEVLPEAIELSVGPGQQWSADGKSFYYVQLKPMAKGAPESTRYDDMRVRRHVVGTPVEQDESVFGHEVTRDAGLPKAGFLDIQAARDGSCLIASHSRGTIATPAYWVRDLNAKTPHWRAIATSADEVTRVALRGCHAYAISRKSAVRGRVLEFDPLRETVAKARVLIPEGEAILATDDGDLAVAHDALYVAGTNNGHALIQRVPFGGEKAAPRPLELPTIGVSQEFTADETSSGLSIAIDSLVSSPLLYRYDPVANTFTDTKLRQPSKADFSGIALEEVEVESTGGVRVPLTIASRRDLKRDGSHPTLMTSYGAYAASVPMPFAATNLAWLERGGVIAFAHVRGGGEKGEAWHREGMLLTKQNTIDDAIACAHYLVDHKYTSPEHLAMAGKSAGGLAVGGAITQHPELFRAALVRVGFVDPLRYEHSSGGDANVPEFGSVKDAASFKVLHQVSPYANVRDGVAYPAVLLETGVNDDRVPPWQPGKFTARLQAASKSDRPVLLRVDYDSGHGTGTDKLQVAELLTDEFAFLGWQLGMPEFATK